jgi:hypothetical protein
MPVKKAGTVSQLGILRVLQSQPPASDVSVRVKAQML